jgi:geranylgeranyl pyrophosphate synthase
MSEQNVDDSTVKHFLRERSSLVNERFGLQIFDRVSDPELYGMLQSVKSYWSDSVRSGLISLSCEAVGSRDPDGLVEFSLLISLVDAGVSIHDDVIDHSQTKHLRKTIVGQYGIEKDILLGDLLIIKAWSILNQVIHKTNQNQQLSEAVRIYHNLCVDMCESQFTELRARKNLEVDLLEFQRALLKANSSIVACTQIGAVLGGGTKQDVETLASYGRHLALLFSLKEEVRDCRNLEGNLTQRLRYESVPLPVLFATKSSRTVQTKIAEVISKDVIPLEDAAVVLNLCFDSGAFDYVCKVAYKEAENAIMDLRSLKANKAVGILELIVRKALTDIRALCI